MFNYGFLFIVLAALAGCATSSDPAITLRPPQPTKATQTYLDLISLPKPHGKMVAAVYNFRDLSGQYKAAPNSNLSSAVTQGADAILVSALGDSNWFIPVERKGLQNILTERKVIRAIIGADDPNKIPASVLPKLLPARILLEGGVVAYESDVKTGGAGFRYLGVGPNTEYRTDQVTINLRAVDVQTGKVIETVSVTKTIISYKLQAGVYQFVAFKKLFEAELGLTYNEPAQLCVMEAIQAAVINLIVLGVQKGDWQLADERDRQSPVIQKYMDVQRELLPRGSKKLG